MRKIKKMDHKQMEDILTGCYVQGQKKTGNAHREALLKALEESRGIGEKKKARILELFDQYVDTLPQ